MDNIKKVKYDSLNTLKGLACIGVIVMHCGFPGIFGKTIHYLFKFNVPVFFLISGFFLLGASCEMERGKIRRQLPKIFRMLLFAFCFYGAVSLIMNIIGPDAASLSTWASEVFQPNLLPRKILFGTFFNGTIWYLYALIWGYLFLLLFSRWISIRRMLWLAPLLLCTHIVLRTYVRSQGYEWYDASYFRSFLLYSVPFILSGYWISINRQKILELKKEWLIVLIGLFGAVLQFVEYGLFGQSLDFYFGSIIYSFALFALAIRHPFAKVNRVLNYIGERLSMPIYIIHMFVIQMVGLFHLNEWIVPILAILFSIALAFIWVIIQQYCKNRNS